MKGSIFDLMLSIEDAEQVMKIYRDDNETFKFTTAEGVMVELSPEYHPEIIPKPHHEAVLKKHPQWCSTSKNLLNDCLNPYNVEVLEYSVHETIAVL